MTCLGRCSRRLHFIIHKKCDIANLTLVFAFKQNNDDKRNISHFSFICFRNVAFQSARRISMHSMKNNENEMKVNLTPIQVAALIQLVDFSYNAFFKKAFLLFQL